MENTFFQIAYHPSDVFRQVAFRQKVSPAGIPTGDTLRIKFCTPFLPPSHRGYSDGGIPYGIFRQWVFRQGVFRQKVSPAGIPTGDTLRLKFCNPIPPALPQGVFRWRYSLGDISTEGIPTGGISTAGIPCGYSHRGVPSA